MFLVLFGAQPFFSQELLKPELQFTNACASNSFNFYEIEITFINAVFNSDNTFAIELSDETGDFTNATTLKQITDKNTAFRFTTNFTIPETVGGNKYKIRIKSTSPEKISPATDFFEAYYMSTEALVLNNFENVTLCKGKSKEVSLSTSKASKYQWYKNGEKFLLAGNSISITEAGLYYAEVYYGSCTSPATSNIIQVEEIESPEAALKGSATVNLCKNTSYTLEATIDNANYTYTWYKNDEVITGLPSYKPSLEVASTAFGNYYVAIENQNGCKSSSSSISIKEIDTEFSLSIESPSSPIILENETKTLRLATDANNASIQWFKDGVLLQNAVAKNLTITTSGSYFAEVTNTINGCTTSKKTGIIVITEPKSFIFSIANSSNYSECESNETSITLNKIEAIDTSSSTYELTEVQMNLLTFEWFLNDVKIDSATTKEITLNNFEDNGSYFATVQNFGIVSQSNVIDIAIKIPEVTIASSDVSNSLCNNKTITLSTNKKNGFSYQWFLNGNKIANETSENINTTETGEYELEVTGFGCAIRSNKISILEFDASQITFDFDEEITLNQGASQILTVFGADAYEWRNSNDEIVSTVNSFEVFKAGDYTVKVTLEGCSVTKSFKIIVIESSVVIQNILTPNGDGINDFWQIPSNLANNPSVEVQVFNSSGSKILETKNYQNNWPTGLQAIKSNVFYFIIKNNENVIKKGTITVIN